MGIFLHDVILKESLENFTILEAQAEILYF